MRNERSTFPAPADEFPLRQDVDWIRGEGHEVNDRQNSKHPSDSTEDGAAQRQVRLLHARPPPEQVLDAEQDHTQHLDDREGILERGISIDGGICRREDEGDVENDEDEDGELDGPRHLDERSVTIFHLQASATAKHFTVFLHATHIHAVLEDGVHLGAKREGLKSQRVGRVRTPREGPRPGGRSRRGSPTANLRESGQIAIIFHVVVVLVIPEETQITQRTRRRGLVFNHR